MKGKLHIILCSALLSLLSSCGKEEASTVQHGAIEFSSAMAGQVKSDPGESPLSRSFVVFGIKNPSEAAAPEVVFPWYNVAYSNGSYYYQGLTSCNGYKQDRKFWDPDAYSYSFAAYAGDGASARNDSPISVRFAGVTPSSVLYLAGTADNTVPHEKIGTGVVLGFRQVQSMIRLGFFESMTTHKIKNVRWSLAGYFPESADFTVDMTNLVILDYAGTPESGRSSRSGTAGETDVFIASVSNEAVKTPYFNVLPVSSAKALDLELTLEYDVLDIETNSVMHESGRVSVVPAHMAAWEPGHAYTYLFKITRTDLVFEGYADVVLDVQPWVDRSDENIVDDMGGLM